MVPEKVDSCNLTNGFHGQVSLGKKLNDVRQVVFTAGLSFSMLKMHCERPQRTPTGLRIA